MRALALIALLAGCTDAATSIHLYVAMPESSSIDQLAVVVESQRSFAPATTELTVLVPDDWGGMPVRLEVEGMASDAVVALGSTDVMPSRGDQITAFVQLVDADCAVVCTPGDVRCEGDGVATCEMLDACPRWSAPVACGADAPFCSNGHCAATCSDECVADTKSCDGTGATRSCGNSDGDPCLDWTMTACGTGEHCDSGACVADTGYVCPSSCSSQTTPASNVGGFASDGAYVYWVDSGSVKRRSETDGAVETIVTRSITAPGPIVVDATHVYWRDTASRIVRAPKGGGSVQAVFSGTSLEVRDIAIYDTYIYWTESTTKIRRRAKDGSGTITDVGHTNSGTPYDLEVDANYMYFVQRVDDSDTDAYVWRLDRDGSGNPLELVSQQRVYSLAIDDTHLYTMALSVERRPKAGGAAEMIAMSPSGYKLAIDATHVAWANGGKVHMRAKSGGMTAEFGAATDEDELVLGMRSVASATDDGAEVAFAPRCACAP